METIAWSCGCPRGTFSKRDAVIPDAILCPQCRRVLGQRRGGAVEVKVSHRTLVVVHAGEVRCVRCDVGVLVGTRYDPR